MRSLLYRFPDPEEFERTMRAAGIEAELRLPPGETLDDGEWVLAIFERGPGGRATSAAGRGSTSPEGARLVLEPRDVKRLVRSGARYDGGGRGPAPVVGPAGFQDPAIVAPAPAPEEAPVTARSPDTGQVAGSSGSRPPPEVRRRVLIVDDDPDIRDVVAAMLEAVGLAVVAVESGEDAIDRVAREAFDLLLLDWNLPRMTGIDLCRAVRRQPGLASLPVLFLTANASSQDMVEAFASGGDDYVVKPFRAPELGARIFSLLRRCR